MRPLRARLPEYRHELIEAETLVAAGCRREVYGWVADTAVLAEARRLVEELLSLGASDQPAMALVLGFEFDRRRLQTDELLRRLICAALLRYLGAREVFGSPVAYQSRARWDLYAPDIETLVALNHLTEETDVVQHLTHHHARAVLWAPPVTDRRPREGWHLLRYTPFQPWPAQRNWFDEVVRQNERQSAERRALQVAARGVEHRVGEIASTLARIDATLTSGEYLTLAEEI